MQVSTNNNDYFKSQNMYLKKLKEYILSIYILYQACLPCVCVILHLFVSSYVILLLLLNKYTAEETAVS